MSDGDDDGWGGTIDEGWSGSGPTGAPPSGPPPTGPPPPYQPPPAGAPPYQPGPRPGYQAGGPYVGGPHGPSRPPGGGGSRSKLLIGGAIGVVVVIVAVVLVVVLASSGKSNNNNNGNNIATPTTAAPTSSPTDSVSSTTVAANSSTPSLLSIAPFTGCEETPKADWGTATLDEIACGSASNISTVSADGAVYERFSSEAALTTWYSDQVVSTNSIVSNTGNCQTVTLETTSKQAQYCEGGFTDTAGASARETLVVAPISVPVNVGGSVALICPNAQSYTFLAFTSPSDDVGSIVVACTGSTQIATTFEAALTGGTLELND